MTDKDKTELAYFRGQLAASLHDAKLSLTKAEVYLGQLIRDAASMTPEQITTTLLAIEAQRLDMLIPMKAAMNHLQNIIRLTPIAELPKHCSPLAADRSTQDGLLRHRGISSDPRPHN